MRCPKCGYITFDHIASCTKCNTNLQNASGGFQGTSANVKPPSLLGSVTKQAPEPSVDDLLDGQNVGFGEDSSDGEGLDLMADDGLELTEDLTDVDLEGFPAQTLESDDLLDDDSIPSLESLSDEPVSAIEDEPLPQLDKITSELNDIDISDLVGSDDSVEEGIPSLDALDETAADDLPTLEPLADDDIPEITPLEDVGAVPELEPLSESESLDDLDLSAEDFEDDDLSTLLDESGLDDFDIGDDSLDAIDTAQTGISSSEDSADEPALNLETEAEPVEDVAGDDLLGPVDDANDEFDLSFDDSPAGEESGAIDLSLDMEGADEPVKTPPPAAAPDIPDLGLTLESDQD